MTASAPVRNLLLSLHVLASVGWVGALAVFLAHALAGLWSDDPRTVAALGLAMGATAWLVILPLAIASLATGVAQALLSAWGLLRHHWVVFKLALTAVATAVLLAKLGPISALAQSSAASGPGMEGLRTSLALHAAGGLAILVVATLLAIYKPAGLTGYGGASSGAIARRLPGGSRPRGRRGLRSRWSWRPWSCWGTMGRPPISKAEPRVRRRKNSRETLDLAIGTRFKMVSSMKTNSREAMFCRQWRQRRCARLALR